MSEESPVDLVKIDGGVWSPIYTLSRNEKKLFATIRGNGIPVYLPLKRHVNVQPVMSKGKSYCYKRESRVAMFPGYLFANVSPSCRSLLSRNRSVVRILPVLEQEEDILLSELRMIRKLEQLSEDQEIGIEPSMARGQRVRFTGGMFAGWEGVVQEECAGSGMVIINISSLQASARIRYPAAWCSLVLE